MMTEHGLSELEGFYVFQGVLAFLFRHPSRPSERRGLLLDALETRCKARPAEPPEGRGTRG
jgi:hypothetical protein